MKQGSYNLIGKVLHIPEIPFTCFSMTIKLDNHRTRIKLEKGKTLLVKFDMHV